MRISIKLCQGRGPKFRQLLRKGDDCILGRRTQYKSIFILKSYVVFLTYCRTGEVIFALLEYSIHVNIYIW